MRITNLLRCWKVFRPKMVLQNNLRFLLHVLVLCSLCLMAVNYFGESSLALPTFAQLSSAGPPPPSTPPVGVALRQLVHLSVDGNDKRPLVEQYANQLNKYFKKDDTEVEAEYPNRLRRVEDFCRNNLRDLRIRPKELFFFFTEKPPLLFCPVAKASSTFWERLVATIHKKDKKILSPFQLIHGGPPKLRVTLGDQDQAKNFQNSKNITSKTKCIFTRDPYHRVFSVFIDKFLSPNHYMWSFGTMAVKLFRSSSKGENLLGSSVRFDEFIRYINAQDKQHINVHVKPVSYTCDLCNLKYDVIGKVETFKTDVNYILKRIGVFEREIVIHNMKFENDVDQIFNYVQRAFGLKKGWLKFISWQAGMMRLWRQLQINGLIDMTNTYPFSPEQSHNLTVVEYVNVALEAFRRSSPAAKRTKREAYLQAYSMVEPEDLEQMRKGFLTDFEMFDYEQRPAELFDMDRERKFEYDYFDVMQLE